jgi:hypothetical protein
MAIKLERFRDYNYGQISRGTSLRIPFLIKQSDESQYSLENFTIYFTLK